MVDGLLPPPGERYTIRSTIFGVFGRLSVSLIASPTCRSQPAHHRVGAAAAANADDYSSLRRFTTKRHTKLVLNSTPNQLIMLISKPNSLGMNTSYL